MNTLDPELQIDKGCVMITEAGNNFSCADATVSQAMLIYHHYQKKRNCESMIQLFATAAFSLSAQICEENVKTEDVIKFFDSLGTSLRKEPCMEILKKKITQVQYDMHRLIFGGQYTSLCSPFKSKDLVLNCDTAHQYVYHYMYQFSSAPKIKKNLNSVKTLCLKYLNTFYCCQKSTTYTAIEVAWAAMYLAFESFEIDINLIKFLKQEEMKAVKSERHRNAMDDMMIVSSKGVLMLESSAE